MIPHGVNTGVSGVCGGSLIDEIHVLTAAHCLVGHSREEMLNTKIIINHLKLSEDERLINLDGGKVVGVIDYKSHPNYDPRLWFHDLAILTLNEVVSGIPFAKLPPRQSALHPELIGKIGNVIGWGTTSKEGGEIEFPALPFSI